MALLSSSAVELVTFEILFHELVVGLDGSFNEVAAVIFGLFDHVGRDFPFDQLVIFVV